MNNPFPKKLISLTKDNRGVTIIIAVGIAALLLAFAVGIAATIQSTQQNIIAFKESSRAQVIAESVMGKLLLLGDQHEAGFSLLSGDMFSPTGINCEKWIYNNFEISHSIVENTKAPLKLKILPKS